MDGNTKLVALVSLLLASTLFISITALEQGRRNERLQKLNDDDWVKQKITEAFPDFPVLTQLGDVKTPSIDIGGGFRWTTFEGQTVERISGQHPEYYRWFVVHQREPGSQYDPANHGHIGFITSDLEVFDVGLDVFLQ